MSAMLTRILAISAGIDPVLAGETGFVPASHDFQSAVYLFRNTSPYQADTAQIDLQELKESFTSSGTAVGRQLGRITPGLVLMSTGGAAQAPNFRLGKYLRMCGMQQASISSSASLRYTFRSTGFESGYVNFGMNDTGSSAIVVKLNRVQGTLTIAGQAGQVITVDPTISGFIATQPTKVAGITATYHTAVGNTAEIMENEGLQIVGNASSQFNGGGTLLSTQVKFKGFTFDQGWDIQEDLDANSDNAFYGLIYNGRNPTLQLTVDANSDQVSKFFTDLQNTSARHTITFLHGSAVGKYAHFSFEGQLTNIQFGDDVGLRTLQLSYNLVSTTNDGEAQITFS